jgi:glutamate-ammonia-ligase adenylyltransferase
LQHRAQYAKIKASPNSSDEFQHSFIMPRLADLLRAESFNEEAVHAKLEAWGFAETSNPAKATARRAFSHSMTSRRTLQRRASRSSAAASGSTPDALRSFAPSRPTSRAEKLVDGFATNPEERDALFPVLDDLLEDLSRAADPLRALLNFSRFCDGFGERIALFRQLQDRPALRARLCQLFGFAQSLSDTLIREPERLETLGEPLQMLSRPELRRRARALMHSGSTPEAKLDTLRRFRRHQTLRIGLLDMERQTWRDEDEFHCIVRQISDLAQVVVEETLRVLCNGETAPFLVIAMGKMGARELNYSSDIDLLFLHDGDTPNVSGAMSELGQRLFKALSDASPEGALYRVDMRLRPEGTTGPLVTPLDYAFSYYESYAGAWEWQALIKARAVAGDAKIARRFRRFTRDITWARRADDSHLKEIVEMKRRSESTPEGANERNVKQGPGAIRDAEWVVQQLQMMVGPSHPRARAKDTLRAIKGLTDLDVMTEAEARDLRDGYLFLRVLEHRLQLWEEQAIRVLPDDENQRAALARRMGCNWRGIAAARWLDEEHTRYRKEIRALCEKMFWGWRNTHDEVGVMNDEQTPAAHLNGTQPSAFNLQPLNPRLLRLAEGTSTQPLPAPLARQIKAVLPTVVQFAEAAPDPERALVNLERLCDASGNRLSLLRSLSDTPRLGRGVLTLLGGSQFLSDTLIRFPELLDLAAQRSLLEARKTGDEARADCRAYCLTFRDRRAALRRWKAREILRIGLRDLVLDASPHDITGEIAGLCSACLDFACDEVGASLRPASHSLAFAVLGMGKLGGREMHYSSDADVVFAHEVLGTLENPASLAARWAEELMKYMGERTEDGAVFSLDPRLRPEGASGALAPNFASFVEYFERAKGGLEIWERQALTRARFVAGDASLAGKLMAAIRHVAFPESWKSEWSDELRHIKTRVENERATKSKTGEEVFDVKLGSGGLSDIEWTAQWLALKHGAAHPALQTRSTLLQIEAARETGVLAAPDADALISAYTFLRRAELRLQIAGENAVAAVKKNSKEWTAWTRAMYSESDDAAARFEAEWKTNTTAARKVFERVREGL